MKKTIFFLFVFGFFVNAYSQEPLWSENYDSGLVYYSDGLTETSPRIFPENENLFKVVGTIKTPDGIGIVVLKYDISGNLISEQIFGNINYAIADYKFDDLGQLYVIWRYWYGYAMAKVVIHKYAPNGALIWEEEIQDIGYFYDPLHLSISENNTILITSKKYIYQYEGPYVDDELTYRLYAYDTNGNQLWERIFDGFTIDDELVYDNEIYFLGNSQLIKVDTDNNVTLNVSIDLEGYYMNGHIYLTQDNKLLIVDYFYYRISKLDLDGSLLWSENYPLPDNTTIRSVTDLSQDEDGNIYITGWYKTDEYYLITLKFDIDGNLLWNYLYPTGLSNNRNNVIALKDGYVYVGGSKPTGISSSDYMVLKINDETADLSGKYIYAGTGDREDNVSSIYAFEDNKIALTGSTYNGEDYQWTTQLLSESSFSVENPEYLENVKLYPNPLDENQMLMIEGENLKSYTVYSLTGQLLQQGKFEAGSVHSIQLESLTKGVYLLKLKADKQTLTKKIVIR
jgi:hypothetical protein